MDRGRQRRGRGDEGDNRGGGGGRPYAPTQRSEAERKKHAGWRDCPRCGRRVSTNGRNYMYHMQQCDPLFFAESIQAYMPTVQRGGGTSRTRDRFLPAVQEDAQLHEPPGRRSVAADWYSPPARSQPLPPLPMPSFLGSAPYRRDTAASRTWHGGSTAAFPSAASLPPPQAPRHEAMAANQEMLPPLYVPPPRPALPPLRGFMPPSRRVEQLPPPTLRQPPQQQPPRQATHALERYQAAAGISPAMADDHLKRARTESTEAAVAAFRPVSKVRPRSHYPAAGEAATAGLVAEPLLRTRPHRPLPSAAKQPYVPHPSYGQPLVPATDGAPALGVPKVAPPPPLPEQENRALLSQEQRGRLFQQLLFVRTFGPPGSKLPGDPWGGGDGDGGDGGGGRGRGGGGGGTPRSRCHTPPLSPLHRQDSDVGSAHNQCRGAPPSSSASAGGAAGAGAGAARQREGGPSAAEASRVPDATTAGGGGREDEGLPPLLPPLAAPVQLASLMGLPPLVGSRTPLMPPMALPPPPSRSITAPTSAAAASALQGRDDGQPAESSYAEEPLVPLRHHRGGAATTATVQPRPPPPPHASAAVGPARVLPLHFPAEERRDVESGEGSRAPIPSPVSPASAAQGGGR
eukprot:TRINITY_DN116_c0_g1_i1.p1 TRINITY_DN116_c0_g1~~TRINITY_DN116_c0_g1_i1.p1  ORF type:complete len:630 (+),score=82.29 TRINITY_DN116_c0_g1_i1:635-2524(+)